MILRHVGTWLESTETHDAEGMVVKSWATFKTGPCDIQPANLNENELKLFGISDQKSSVKRIYFESDDTIVEGMRFYDIARAKLYDVRGSNEWDIHNVILGIPVLGEVYAAPLPVITYFGPLSGSEGSTVTIHGTSFVSVSAVHIGAVAVTSYAVTDSHTITATLPSGAVTGTFSVTTSTGTATSPESFTVVPNKISFSVGTALQSYTFAPVLELNAGYSLGSNATVLWTFDDATTNATLTPSHAYTGVKTQTLTVTPWAALKTLDLGYGGEDGGSLSIPTVANQHVNSISNLFLASALKTFCASYSPITDGTIFSGMSITTIEAYQAGFTSFSAPATIQRLCVEDCAIAGTLDLSACSALTDLRAALNSFTAIVLPASAPNLWHLCFRNNALTSPPMDYSAYTALEDLYSWSTNMAGELTIPASMVHLLAYDNAITSLDFPGGALGQVNLANNALTPVDAMINAIAAQGLSGGELRLNGGTNAYPTSASLAARTALTSAGWTTQYNVFAGTDFVTTGDTAVFLVSCSGDPTDLTITWSDGTSTTQTVGASAVDFSRAGLGSGSHTHSISAVDPTKITALQSDGNSSTISLSNLGYFSGLTSCWFYMASALSSVGSIAACTALDTVRMGSTAMSAATQDALAADLVAAGVSGGNWFYSAATGFTSASAADRSTLASRGWTLSAA